MRDVCIHVCVLAVTGLKWAGFSKKNKVLSQTTNYSLNLIVMTVLGCFLILLALSISRLAEFMIVKHLNKY